MYVCVFAVVVVKGCVDQRRRLSIGVVTTEEAELDHGLFQEIIIIIKQPLRLHVIGGHVGQQCTQLALFQRTSQQL
jgi:hypothetical protein